jgi:hypothetical protein
MVQEMSFQGICVSCNYRSECLSLRNSLIEDKPVLQCEEFDDSADKTNGSQKKTIPNANIENLENIDVVKLLKARGLCINCDDNGTCKFPYFGNAVIYCEEYI